MNLNQLFSFFIQFASSVGAISKEDASKAEQALDNLFPEPENDPNAGEDTVKLSQTADESFKATAGDDGHLELDELKKRAEDYLSKYATQEEKEKYGPMMGIFLDENNKVDEELYKELAGDKNYLTAEDIKKLDTNGDGRVTKEEVAAYKKSVAGGETTTKGPQEPDTPPVDEPDVPEDVPETNPTPDVDEPDTPDTPPTTPPSIEDSIQDALNDPAVQSLKDQVEKAQEEVEKLSAEMRQNETVAAAIKTLDNFNVLIGKLASATDPNELNNIMSQIQNQAAAVASAQKVINQAVQDDAKQVYNDPIATDINSFLGQLPNEYQDYYTKDETIELASYDKKDKTKDAAKNEFEQKATAILNSVAAALRKELKAQLGDKYNAAEIEQYIKTAMEQTINYYKENAYALSRGDGEKDYNAARGKHALIFEPKGDGKYDDKGRWTFSVKSLMDDFMKNYKAAVNNTPTQQVTDIKDKAKDKYAEFQDKSQAIQMLQNGGRVYDQNGNVLHINIKEYMSDYQKEEVEKLLDDYSKKQQEINELMQKMNKATTAQEAKEVETQLTELYQELGSMRSSIGRYVSEAYYSYQYQHQQNNPYGYNSSVPLDMSRFTY